jgi:peptidoglycan hydrolase-like protein with peptidoglycan-binding domain
MTLRRGRQIVAEGLLAAGLIACAGLCVVASGQAKPRATQPKAASSTKPKASSRKLPAKTAAKSRAQAAPTRDRIVEIQQALAREGFYQSAPSGKWDDETTQAMRNFQTAKGLVPTGKLGALSLQKLGLGSEIAGRGAPLPVADARPSALSESDLNESAEPAEPAEPPAK